MIKNFIVKVKQIKHRDAGLRNFINYLTDEKRHPDGIVNFKKHFEKEKFFKNTLKNIVNFELEKKLAKKAGRKMESYADSFIFTIPPELYNKLNTEKQNEIAEEIIKKLYKLFSSILKNEYNLDIDVNTFVKHIFINIHTNKHIHFNFVMPRVIKLKNGEYFSNRITNRKRFLHLAKASWNQIIFEKLGVSTADYKPKTKLKNGYKNQYMKDLINENNEILEKNIEVKKKVEEDLEKMKKLDEWLGMKRKEIKEEVLKLAKEHKERNKIARSFQLMIRYYNSIAEKILNNEQQIKINDFWNIENQIKELEKLNTNKILAGVIDEVKQQTKTFKKTYFKM